MRWGVGRVGASMYVRMCASRYVCMYVCMQCACSVHVRARRMSACVNTVCNVLHVVCLSWVVLKSLKFGHNCVRQFLPCPYEINPYLGYLVTNHL